MSKLLFITFILFVYLLTFIGNKNRKEQEDTF